MGRVGECKVQFQHGQHHNTHSQGLIDHLEMKVDAAAAKYRAVQQSINNLASLLGHVGWEINFLILNDSDIKGLSVIAGILQKVTYFSTFSRWGLKRLSSIRGPSRCFMDLEAYREYHKARSIIGELKVELPF